MQPMILTAATIILAASAFFALTPQLQMLQQNSYYNTRYLSYLRTAFGWRSVLAGIGAALLVLFLWIPVWNGMVFLILAALFSAIRAWDTLRRQKNAIKPLVVTARVTRMYATAGVFLAVLGIIAALLPASRALMMAMCVLWLFTPLLALLANLVNRPLERAVAKHYIHDAQRILASHTGLRVIGVTGSYGKTSTKYILGRMLSERFDVLITPGSYNTPMGVVRTVREQLKGTTEVFVCEMGAKQVGDIKEICDICHPDMGVITSIGPQHLNTFHSMENIVSTKFELADAVLERGGRVFCNMENEFIRDRAKNLPCTGYGLSPKAGVWAGNVSFGRGGASFEIHAGERCIPVHTKLLGSHAVLNITAAAAVAVELGLTDTEIKVAVSQLAPVPHRLELKGFVNHSLLIDDAYNSNPEGCLAAVKVLNSFEGMKKIIVTPGLVELGEREYECNFALGAAAAKVCDEMILVGEQRSVPLADGARSANYPSEKLVVVKSFQEALQRLKTYAERDTVVLIENDLPDNYAR